MSDPSQNEDKVRQDFDRALQTVQKALAGVLEAIKKLAESLAQLLKNIQESTARANKRAAAGHLTGTQAGDLKTKAETLSSQNTQLEKALSALNLAPPSLHQEGAERLRAQLKEVNLSLRDAKKLNKELSSLVHAATIAHESKPIEGKQDMEKRINTVLSEAGKTAQQALRTDLSNEQVMRQQFISGLHASVQSKTDLQKCAQGLNHRLTRVNSELWNNKLKMNPDQPQANSKKQDKRNQLPKLKPGGG